MFATPPRAKFSLVPLHHCPHHRVATAPLRILSCAGALLFRGSFVFPPISLCAALSSFLTRFLSSFFTSDQFLLLSLFSSVSFSLTAPFSRSFCSRFGPPRHLLNRIFLFSDRIMVKELENCPVAVRLQSDRLNISTVKGIIKQYYKHCGRQL